MPITYVNGDLLDSNCQAIAHGCNCFHTFGAGIAKQIRTKYPSAFMADLNTKAADRDKLGRFSTAVARETNMMIFNLYTQFKYGRGQQVEYPAMQTAFKNLSKTLDVLDPANEWKVGMPRIGAGLGGGDWDVIANLIEEAFTTRTIHIYSL